MKNKLTGFLNNNKAFIVAFLVPVLIMLIVYISKDIYPFGEMCYLRSDMYHQYAPFHKALWELLHGDGSILYSWNIGLGTDFVSLAAYYLASPLNLLLLFFTEAHVIEAMSIFIIFKMGLCGLTFSVYLSNRFKTKNLLIAAFSVFYALSSYAAAFSWNLMWADCLWLLPLVAMGIERLIIEKKPLVYGISLAFCAFSNYYIAIMVSIFSLLYFFVILFTRRGLKLKDVGNRIKLFVIYSLIAAAIAAVMILPAFFTLKLSASGDISFPTSLKEYFSALTGISRMYMNEPVSMFEAHTPNLYSSVLVFIFIPLYVLNRKIDIREKIGKIALLVFIFISFMFNVLDFLWHGCHFPNSLAARESFIFIFLILAMSFEGFMGLKTYTKKEIALVFAGVIGLLVLIDHLFVGDDFDASIIYVSAIFIFLYFILCFGFRKKFKYKNLIVYALFVITIIEASINTSETAVGTVSRTDYLRDNAQIESLLEAADHHEDELFYRVEKEERRTKNDASWIGYKGASIFSSTANAGVSKFYGDMGLEESANAYAIYGATPLTQAMLSVKYQLSDNDKTDDDFYTLIDQEGDKYIYKHKYWLSPGYMVPSSLENSVDMDALNPFVVQNAFASAATGYGSIFTNVKAGLMGDSVSMQAYESGRYYTYISTSLDSVIVTYYDTDGTYLTSKTVSSMTHSHILDLGELESGQSVSLISNDSEVVALSAEFAKINEEALDAVMSELSDEMWQISDYDNTHLSGTIDVKNDGVFLTSVPYEPGWSVYVDGERVETHAFKGAFVSFDLSAGHHEIVMKYMPQGFIPGLIISLAGVTAMICLITYRVRKSKGEKMALTDEGPKDKIEQVNTN
ncbi:MAG: hypothetical protein E7242_10450 [Lachnospiraceae bacterium]|nr:hypothetical protein [Lachnospiraceae bacterium]